MKLFIFAFLFSSLTWAAVTADQIVEKADGHRGLSTDFVMKVMVKDFAATRMLREMRYEVSVKSQYLTLVNTVFPTVQKGRKFLFSDENLWFYTPTIKRSTRVSLQQRLTGEVSNGDLANSNFRGDYDAKMVGEEKLGDRTAWKLELKAKKKSATYAGITYWVEKNTFVPLKAAYQTESKKVLKNCIFEDVKKFEGVDLVTKLTITDALQSTRYSVMTYSGFQKKKLDDSIFNKDALGND